jgi:hypothetical protein
MKQQSFFGTAIPMLLVFNSLSIYGQSPAIQYNLRNYDLPFLKRQVLELQFNFTSTDQSNALWHNAEDVVKSSNQHFLLQLQPVYSFCLNTPKFQLQQDVTAGLPAYFFSSSRTQLEESSSTTFSPDFSWSSENRFYIRSKFFIETDMSLTVSYHTYSIKSKEWNDQDTLITMTNSDSHGSTTNLYLPISFG